MRSVTPKIARLADWHRIKGSYGLNRRVKAVVVRQVGLGGICRVDDRFPALLRNREMSWNPDEQRHDFLAENESFEAVVVGHNNDRRELIISKRAADPNPLEQFLIQHPNGSSVEGRVVRILPSGDVVLYMEGGVEGLVPRHLLPTVKQSDEITDKWAVRVEDWVRAQVYDVDRGAGHVRLSVEAARLAAEREWPDRIRTLEVGPQLVPHRVTVLANPPPAPAPPTLARLSVLLIENDDEISGPLAFYLQNRGHRVRVVASRHQAEQVLAALDGLDVALIDLQLNGDHGGGLLQQAREQFPAARLYLFTGSPVACFYPQHGLANAIIEKPIDTHELVAIVENRNGVAPHTRSSGLDEGAGQALGRGAADVGTTITHQLIDAHLQAAQELCPRATAIALLAHDAAKSEVRCLRAHGAPPDVFARFAKPLFFSPVENVLVESRPMRVSLARMTNPPAGFVGFMTALRAATLVGLPVPAESVPLSMGLFVFLPEQWEAGSDVMTRLQVRVDALAVALDRAMLNAQLLQNQRALCAGVLFLTLTHELSNGIQAVLGQLSLVRDSLGDRHAHAFTPADRLARVDGAVVRVKGLQRTIDELLATVKPKTGSAATTLAEVLAQVFESTRSTADHHNVRLYLPDLTNPRVRDARVPVLLQQALLNLVLNALQHTGAYRVANGLQNGHVVVTVEPEVDEDGDGEWVVIRIKDNGPGLDGEATERVFDMYHTTRKRGSGLGLYITRSIVESSRGTVVVERSVKFVETTFLVRIPTN